MVCTYLVSVPRMAMGWTDRAPCRSWQKKGFSIGHLYMAGRSASEHGHVTIPAVISSDVAARHLSNRAMLLLLLCTVSMAVYAATWWPSAGAEFDRASNAIQMAAGGEQFNNITQCFIAFAMLIFLAVPAVEGARRCRALRCRAIEGLRAGARGWSRRAAEPPRRRAPGFASVA